MNLRLSVAGVAAGLTVLAAAPSFAHGVVGPRFFPATLATDDPAVADELSLPTVAMFDTADGSHETDVSAEYSRRLFENLDVSVGPSWSRIRTPGGPATQGWNNLETSVKWQFVTDPEHELIVSAGLGAEWGGSGSRSLGVAKITDVAPTLYFGKGFGDLPKSADGFRPFAITGLVGYHFPVRDHVAGNGPGDVEVGDRSVEWGLALEYSFPYLASQVHDYGFPNFVNHLTPLIEATFESPVAPTGGKTTGTINPGVIWAGRSFQFGAEAVIPLNRASGRGVGGMVQLHLYLDDLLASTIGRPLIERRIP